MESRSNHSIKLALELTMLHIERSPPISAHGSGPSGCNSQVVWSVTICLRRSHSVDEGDDVICGSFEQPRYELKAKLSRDADDHTYPSMPLQDRILLKLSWPIVAIVKA